MRKLGALMAVLAAGGVAAYLAAGFAAGPSIAVPVPERFVGAATPVEVTIVAPGAELTAVDIAFEQNGVRTRVAGLETGAVIDGDQARFMASVGRANVPDLASGPARIVVTATRPVLFGLRQASTETAHDVEVRLDPPRLGVLSTHHYVNLGGTEAIVYRVTPDDAASGVQVGDLEYPGYPASGATVDGVVIADPAVHVAFFALLQDQDASTPIQLFARDPAGNASTAPFEYRVFPKQFRRSRIGLDDAFINRVVPSILANTPDFVAEGSPIERYVAINSILREQNADRIASFASQTASEMLWQGVVFHPFTNNAVESGFADRRTYVYEGRDVDQQVHLGFDLASFAQTPIVAASRGRVLFAEPLGIYGNCVIIDHGMGVQSLYAHLSTIDVVVGDTVEREQTIGRSGMTGLAGGDHLHFTMLVHGRMVNPIEWWDSHWIEDRILRKLRAAQ